MRAARRFSSLTILLILFSLLNAPAGSAQQKNSWDNSIDSLSAKISAAAGARPVSVHINVKNFSSLDAARIADFQQALEANLQHRGIKLTSDTGADAKIDVTISENLRAIIFAAEVQRGDSPEVVLATVDRADAEANSEGTAPVRLEREFIWSQPDPMLDFIVLQTAPGATPLLAVLEPRRLVIYRSAEGRWQPQESHPLPTLPPARDPRGSFTSAASDPDATIAVDLPGAKCTLKTQDRIELTCSTMRDIRGGVETDFVSLPFNCGARNEAILTGDTDWTRPDSLRVVEVTDHPNQVGEAMAFSGPILALWKGTQSATARVIWRDLATGDYEAAILTATCSP